MRPCRGLDNDEQPVAVVPLRLARLVIAGRASATPRRPFVPFEQRKRLPPLGQLAGYQFNILVLCRGNSVE